MNLLGGSHFNIISLISVFTSNATVHHIKVIIYKISLLSTLVLTPEESVSSSWGLEKSLDHHLVYLLGRGVRIRLLLALLKLTLSEIISTHTSEIFH